MLKGMFVKVSTKPSQKYYINKKAGKKNKKKTNSTSQKVIFY